MISILLAAAFLFATLILIVFLEPGMNPPGYTGRGAYGMIAILIGAFVLAGRHRNPLPFLSLGAIGAMLLIPSGFRSGTLSFNLRWNTEQPPSPELWASLIGWIFFVLVVAFLSRTVAKIRWRLIRNVPLENPICRHCGYDLRATTGQCPECGNAFDLTNPKTYRAARRYWDFKWLIKRALCFMLAPIVVLLILYIFLYFRSQQSAIAAIEASGGQVDTTSDLPDALRNWPAALPISPVQNLFRHADAIVWRNRPITDDQLVCLRNLPRVTEVHIDNAPLTGTGFTSAKDLTGLAYLYLPGSNIDDAGLIAIGHLSSLNQLELSGTKVTDAGISQLANLHNLNVLWLENTTVTDVGLMQLTRMPKLKHLFVGGSKVTSKGLDRFNLLRPDVSINGQ